MIDEDSFDENQRDTIRNTRAEFRNCIRSIIHNHESNLIPIEVTKKELSMMFCCGMFSELDPKQHVRYFINLHKSIEKLLLDYAKHGESMMWEMIPKLFKTWEDPYDK